MGSVALGQRLVERLRAAGRRPYLIPVGGSNGLGSWGYLEAVREIELQAGERPFTDIALVRHSGLEAMELVGYGNKRWTKIYFSGQETEASFLTFKLWLAPDVSPAALLP